MKRGLAMPLLLASLGLGLVATGCAGSGGPVGPTGEQGKTAPGYFEALTELPLRFDAQRWHLSLLDTQGASTTGKAVREVHLMRDLRNPRLDMLLVVADDLTLRSVNARDFTVNWVSKLADRTEYAPVMTQRSIFFVDRTGRYQQFDRHTGLLTKIDRFGLGLFPSAPVAANDTHVVIPATNRNSVEGFPDARGTSIGAAQTWSFPSAGSQDLSDFGMVRSAPIADLETIYFITNNNYLFAVSALDGTRRFKVDLGRTGAVRTRPIISGDLIIVGSDTQLFAISRGGEVVWTHTLSGEVFEGPIYAMDDQIIVRTGKLGVAAEGGDQYRSLSLARTTQPGAKMEVTVEPGRLVSFTNKRSNPPVFDNEPEPVRGQPDPIRKDAEGRPVAGPTLIQGPTRIDWELPNLGQEVLLRTDRNLFVLATEWEIPYTTEQRERLYARRQVMREEELRTYTKRIVQVLDPKTGQVRDLGGIPGSILLNDFRFMIGSNDPTDRAVYFVTTDGHLFKGFARD